MSLGGCWLLVAAAAVATAATKRGSGWRYESRLEKEVERGRGRNNNYYGGVGGIGRLHLLRHINYYIFFGSIIFGGERML